MKLIDLSIINLTTGLIQKELEEVKIFRKFVLLLLLLLSSCINDKNDTIIENNYLFLEIYPSKRLNSFLVLIDFSSELIFVKNKNALNENYNVIKDNVIKIDSKMFLVELKQSIVASDFCKKKDISYDIIDGVLTSIMYYDGNKIISCDLINYSISEMRVFELLMNYLIENDNLNSSVFMEF